MRGLDFVLLASIALKVCINLHVSDSDLLFKVYDNRACSVFFDADSAVTFRMTHNSCRNQLAFEVKPD